MTRRHERRRIGVALVLALAALAVAGDAQAGESGAETAKPLAELEKQYAETQGSAQQKFEAVKAGYEALAAAHPGTEEALTAKLFLLQNTRWEQKAGTMNASASKLADEILAGWPKSERLLRLVEMRGLLGAKKTRPVLEALLETSPHDGVKAESLLALATIDLASSEPAAGERAKSRFGELTKRYGDVKRRGFTPYREIAEAALSPHAPADLAVGKTAPDIVGRDLDGKEMKLSDFRGKVVVLDFWGDW